MGGEADVLLRVEISLGGGLSAMALNPNDPRAVTLALYIQHDVQAVDEMARIYLNDLGTVERGEVRREEITGNSFTVTIEPEGILIEDAVPGFEDYPSQSYRHSEYRHALEQVLTILEEGSRTGQAAVA